jgi:hypothetical protein
VAPSRLSLAFHTTPTRVGALDLGPTIFCYKCLVKINLSEESSQGRLATFLIMPTSRSRSPPDRGRRDRSRSRDRSRRDRSRSRDRSRRDRDRDRDRDRNRRGGGAERASGKKKEKAAATAGDKDAGGEEARQERKKSRWGAKTETAEAVQMVQGGYAAIAGLVVPTAVMVAPQQPQQVQYRGEFYF